MAASTDIRFVYVIQAADGPVKIGHSTDAFARMQFFQTGHHERLRLRFITPLPADLAQRVERSAHALLQDCALTGEWFSATADQAVSAIRQAAERFGVYAELVETDAAGKQRPIRILGVETAPVGQVTPLSPEEVRAFREAQGWSSQDQAAKAFGVSRRTWVGWEIRKVDPNDPAKGAPPLYMRLAFAAFEAGLAPWVGPSTATPKRAEKAPAPKSKPAKTRAVPAPKPTTKRVSVGALLSLPENAKLR